jgi:hypothetical protein
LKASSQFYLSLCWGKDNPIQYTLAIISGAQMGAIICVVAAWTFLRPRSSCKSIRVPSMVDTQTILYRKSTTSSNISLIDLQLVNWWVSIHCQADTKFNLLLVRWSIAGVL